MTTFDTDHARTDTTKHAETAKAYTLGAHPAAEHSWKHGEKYAIALLCICVYDNHVHT